MRRLGLCLCEESCLPAAGQECDRNATILQGHNVWWCAEEGGRVSRRWRDETCSGIFVCKISILSSFTSASSDDATLVVCRFCFLAVSPAFGCNATPRRKSVRDRRGSGQGQASECGSVRAGGRKSCPKITEFRATSLCDSGKAKIDARDVGCASGCASSQKESWREEGRGRVQRV